MTEKIENVFNFLDFFAIRRSLYKQLIAFQESLDSKLSEYNEGDISSLEAIQFAFQIISQILSPAELEKFIIDFYKNISQMLQKRISDIEKSLLNIQIIYKENNNERKSN
jgi:hypothetical protein